MGAKRRRVTDVSFLKVGGGNSKGGGGGAARSTATGARSISKNRTASGYVGGHGGAQAAAMAQEAAAAAQADREAIEVLARDQKKQAIAEKAFLALI